MVKQIRKEGQHPEIAFFGVPLDPTDDPLKMKFKLSLAQDRASKTLRFESPYTGMRSYLKDLFDAGNFEDKGEIEIPSWLKPAPSIRDLAFLTPPRNANFIEVRGMEQISIQIKYVNFIDRII